MARDEAVRSNSVRVRRELSIGQGPIGHDTLSTNAFLSECTHGPVDEIHTSHEFGWFCRTVMPG